ncbi:unnamed protein product [Mytilus coruscus]|uniref:Uncharacterized protein n=1 Tax=Mytilus coruscus TaxID=42192 RepID=A0A6J8EKN9_MYTCO|nr:unnamed protein product [Mytilus coruscus]
MYYKGDNHCLQVYILEQTSHPFILGTSYLKDNKITIDFGESEVVQKHANIRCRKRITLDPHSEILIWGRLPRNIHFGYQGMCESSTQILSHGLISSKAVVTVSQDRTVPVKILNPGSNSVVIPKGIVARQVQLNGNITENIGTNGTKLTCNFTMDQGDIISSVWILATNITLHDFENVVSFDLDFGPKLQRFGKFLFGKVTLSPFNRDSKRVSLSFDDLNCKHSRLYKCKLTVKRVDNPSITTESEAIRISAQVPPSKPDDILLLNLEITSTPVITDGDIVSFVCTGDVGKPPEKFIFQKYRHDHILQMNYTSTNTSIQELSDNCSYYRTSYITLQVTADDNKAVIRCAVVSPMTEMSMYVESEPLEVYYAVRMPTIIKDPNKTVYPTTFKSMKTHVIVIVVGTVCESIILVLCAILFGVIQNKNKCLLMRNRNDRSLDYVNTIHQHDLSLYEGVDHALEVHNYDQISTGEHQYTNTNLSSN